MPLPKCKLSFFVLIASSALVIASGIDLSNKEVWFGPNSSDGTGTFSDPYNATNLNSALNGVRYGSGTWLKTTNVSIRLHPGVYEISQPSEYTKERMSFGGFSLRGSGMYSTTLKLVAASDTSQDHWVLQGTAGTNAWGHIYIADLGIDCNYLGVSAKKVGAIATRGSSGSIERVRAFNHGALGTTTDNSEVFVILRQSPVNGTGTFAIRDCLVEGATQGGTDAYAAAIAVWGADSGNDSLNSQCIIEGNRVINVTDGSGVNLASANNVIIANNYFENLTSGAGADESKSTGSFSKITVVDNLVVNTGIGFLFGHAASNSQGIFESVVIRNNTVILDDKVSSWTNYKPSGIDVRGGVRNTVIDGNTITVRDDFKSTNTLSNWYGIRVRSLNSSITNQNISVVNNAIYDNLEHDDIDSAEVAKFERNSKIESGDNIEP